MNFMVILLSGHCTRTVGCGKVALTVAYLTYHLKGKRRISVMPAEGSNVQVLTGGPAEHFIPPLR